MIRVLIADDEPPARDKLQRWLSEQTDVAVVGHAEDGLQAASAMERMRPDVAFLDIQMPGLSGLEVAAQLEQATAPLIVFVTAYDEHAVKAFDLNAIDYLLKPYDKERLLKSLARVRERLGNRESRASAVIAARAQTGSADRLLVPEGERLQPIDSASIDWLELTTTTCTSTRLAGDICCEERCRIC
jgi:two-component system LytT family response regulator